MGSEGSVYIFCCARDLIELFIVSFVVISYGYRIF